MDYSVGEENMHEELLIYRFTKILDLMRDVGRRFLSDGWKEFEFISPLFVQRFSHIYPDECKTIENYTKTILSSKKYTSSDLKVMRDAMNVIVDGYKDKEKKLHPPKPNKVFISHSGEDKKIVEKFVDLLNRIGLDRNTLFCSSVPGFNIKQGSGDIFDYLRSEFDNNNLFVVFMLSKNYYESAACLNEMGATWILQKQYQTILLPEFDFKDIVGAINPRDISFKLDDKYNRTSAIGEFKDNVINFLQLNSVDSSVWDYSRERFFNEIDNI